MHTQQQHACTHTLLTSTEDAELEARLAKLKAGKREATDAEKREKREARMGGGAKGAFFFCLRRRGGLLAWF